MTEEKDKSFEEKCVDKIIDLVQENKATAAALRVCDNPRLEYRCWDVLVWFGVDIEIDYLRLPYVIVIASIAKNKVECDGNIDFGRSLAMVYDDGCESKPATAKLRRLLSCESTRELTTIIRPILHLIMSKLKDRNLCITYSKLLKDLISFNNASNRERIKTRWASQFYSYRKEEKEVNDE